MKTLVTGATGLVGSALVRQLVAQGLDVRILRRSHSKVDLLGPDAASVEHVIGDVRDPESLRLAMRDIDHVYHVAGFVGVTAREKGLIRHMRKVNVDGTANVVDAALEAGVRRLVHTSSIAALGRSEGRAFESDETAVWKQSRMNSDYAVSKRDAELQVHRGIAEGLDAVLVNPSVVFGPGRPGESTMPIFELVTRRHRLPAPGGGTNVVDVEDVAAGHILAMQRGRTGERYILGGENLPWKEIFSQILEAVGKTPSPRRLSPALAIGFVTVLELGALLFGKNPPIDRKTVRGMFQFWRLSSDKAIRELGYSFRPFAETVRRMAAA